MTHWRRGRLGGADRLRALGVAAGAGFAALYLAIVWLEREPLPEGTGSSRPDGSGHRRA